MQQPLLTAKEHGALAAALAASRATCELSLDLGLSRTTVALTPAGWQHGAQLFPYLAKSKGHTVYYWDRDDGAFAPVARFDKSLIKLVPTDWGPPTFEIDGIKMLPTAQVCPYADAQRKVALIEPKGKIILDTCGGLGYFAAWCIKGGAQKVQSFEKNPDVIWLRAMNPWSPEVGPVLSLTSGDISHLITGVETASVDAILHDPPRFGIAGELYSQVFYDQLARVIKKRGLLFHYTGSPNRLTSNRDVPKEVSKRLRLAGFQVRPEGDGLLAVRL